ARRGVPRDVAPAGASGTPARAALEPGSVSALLVIDRLSVRYGSRDVLRGLSLEVARGEIVALMGPSGVGKSTALRVVAALQPFDDGRIVVDGFALAPGPVPPESRLAP